MDEKKSEE